MLREFTKSESTFILFDQALVSGGNFLTTLVLARTLAPSSYGIFSLILLFLYAINTCHNSLVIYPLTMRVAKGTAEDLPGNTASSLLQTILLALPLAVACLLFSVVTKQGHIAFALIIAMLAWQMQETTRRALLASQNAQKALLPDSLCFLGQGLILLALRPQSLTAILSVIILTSAIALLWQMVTLRVRPAHIAPNGKLLENIRYSWSLGSHILGGNLFNMVALQLPSWTLAWFGGPVSVAGYQSLLNLAGIANPIIFSVNTSLIPTVARSAADGYAAARRTALRLGLQYGALMLPLFLALALLPRWVMRLIYGASTPYLHLATLLPIVVAAYAIQYIATVIGAYEGGMSRPQTYLYVQSLSTIALAALCFPLTRSYGIRGTVWAVAAFSVFRVVLFALFSASAERKATLRGNTAKGVSPMVNQDTAVAGADASQRKITICLLTYKRPEFLRATLDSLMVQTLLGQPAYRVNVVIVDNDEARSAEACVESAVSRSNLPMQYVSNPRNGLSTGRNLALSFAGESDFVALIDDDETASPRWLEELVGTADKQAADVVAGPVVPHFIEAPKWVSRGGFFNPEVGRTGDRVQNVASNNTLLRKNVYANFRFDVKFDRAGGEDTDFFLRVGAAGHRMIWCNEAQVCEFIPPSRTNANWIIDRARSNAARFTHAYLGIHRGASHKMLRICKGFGGLLTGLALLPLSILGKEHYVRSMAYFARSAGTLGALSGEVQRSDYAGTTESAQTVARADAKITSIVVAGQTPPPLNGQTIMIREFVSGVYDNIAITYVPMRFSRSTAELGKPDLRKALVIFSTIFAILRARFRSGASVLYYPPAGANLVPVIRDFLILIVCRPFFKQTAFHFHAAGLSSIYPRLPAVLRPLFWMAYDKPDLAIFTTESTSVEASFLHAKQVSIVPCGIADRPSLSHDDRASGTRVPTILFAGIVCEGKGMCTLLEACSLLKRRQVSFHLEVMGAASSVAFQNQCQSFLESHDLVSNVTFRGVLSGDEKAAAFREASVFCLPSHYPAESFGVVLIEAMSNALPIIATDWQGIPEVTGRDGQGSLLVPIKDPQSLASALERLLQSDEERRQMGLHNRERYLSKYTLSHYRASLSSCLGALTA